MLYIKLFIEREKIQVNLRRSVPLKERLRTSFMSDRQSNVESKGSKVKVIGVKREGRILRWPQGPCVYLYSTRQPACLCVVILSSDYCLPQRTTTTATGRNGPEERTTTDYNGPRWVRFRVRVKGQDQGQRQDQAVFENTYFTFFFKKRVFTFF